MIARAKRGYLPMKTMELVHTCALTGAALSGWRWLGHYTLLWRRDLGLHSHRRWIGVLERPVRGL